MNIFLKSNNNRSIKISTEYALYKKSQEESKNAGSRKVKCLGWKPADLLNSLWEEKRPEGRRSRTLPRRKPIDKRKSGVGWRGVEKWGRVYTASM